MLDNLRVLRKPSAKDGGFQNLLDLQHAPEMCVWDKGYDEHGFWSIPRARAAAAAERARATQAGPKKRKRKQPSYWRTKEGKAQVADKLAGAAIGASVPSRKR